MVTIRHHAEAIGDRKKTILALLSPIPGKSMTNLPNRQIIAVAPGTPLEVPFDPAHGA